MEHQISIFDDEPLTKFEQAIQRGSLTAGGKYRIYGASINLSISDLANFLKEEYGYEGFSFLDGFANFNSNGVERGGELNLFAEDLDADPVIHLEA